MDYNFSHKFDFKTDHQIFLYTNALLVKEKRKDLIIKI